MSCIITLKNPALMRFPHISCWRYCVAKCQGGTSTCIYAHAHLNPSASIYVKVFLHAMSSLSIQNLRFEQPFHSDFFMGLRKWLAYFRLNRSSGVPSTHISVKVDILYMFVCDGAIIIDILFDTYVTYWDTSHGDLDSGTITYDPV